MPSPYYNTQAPTAGSKNSINSITVSFGIRDFLLHKNIINPVKYPQLARTYNGAPKGGEPVLDTMVGTGNVINHPSVEVSSKSRYENAVSGNRYKNITSTASALSGINTIPSNSSVFRNSTVANGINTYPSSVDSKGLKAKTEDKQFRTNSTTRNQYLDKDKQIDVADMLGLQTNGFGNQMSSYINENGTLAIGNANRGIDLLGSVLNGQGIGIGNAGLVANFDIRASLGGRVLTATGLMKDTKLGIIGGRQLALALANNVAFNTQQATLGQYDLNPLSIIKNRGIGPRRANYRITVGDNKILNIAQRILGFEVPTSQLGAGGSIFSTESGSISNILRANSMLEDTGKGQRLALMTQLKANMSGIGEADAPAESDFRSGYVPGFKVKGKFILDGKPSIYAYGDLEGDIYNFVGNRATSPIMVGNADFDLLSDSYATSTIMTPTFSWGSTNDRGVNLSGNTIDLDLSNKKTLLAKTQALFNSSNMMNIISNKGVMNQYPSQIQTAVVGGGISRGSAVKTSKALKQTFDTAEETFCRSWTTFDRYDRVSKLVRHSGLNRNGDGKLVMDKKHWRGSTNGSVLDDNGFVKIVPYKGQDQGRKSTNPKKYMLSIENLAWAGTPALNLLPVEQGNGDLLSSKFGRIMWFPPYDLNVTENDSASWESTNFIGRGEPIYTYNNSERTGTLSFKIIVDHPSQMNGFAGSNGPMDDEIASYFAGCTNIEGQWLDKMTTDEVNTFEKSTVVEVTKVNVDKQIAPAPFSVYFLNDVTQVILGYEDGDGFGFGPYTTEPQTHAGVTRKSRVLIDGANSGLNKTWLNPVFQSELRTHLKEKCPNCSVKIKGYASSQGWVDANKALATNRANNFYKWFQANILLPDDPFFKNRQQNDIEGKGQLDGTGNAKTSIDADGPKGARRVDISFSPDPNMLADKIIEENKKKKKTKVNKISKKITNRYYNEASFFEKMAKDSPFVFDEIRKKIKYFHPAFHSMTPEGLNSRLTFLHQCTRQGPTLNGRVENLAFGTPPVCILRIGDFFNTKIIIDNIGYDYEQLWDLNPEGVGVQPMIANVNISFKFVGGSSLESPINKLQNALSFNYYANSQVYDARADYVAVDKAINSNSDKPGYRLYNDFDISTDIMSVDPEITTVTEITDPIELDQLLSNEASTKIPEAVPADTSVDDVSKFSITNIVRNADSLKVSISVPRITKDYTIKVTIADVKGNLLKFSDTWFIDSSTSQLIEDKVFTKFVGELIANTTYTLKLNFTSVLKAKTFVA